MNSCDVLALGALYKSDIFFITVKKLQFNHVLTATCIDLHIENSKRDKEVILATITSTNSTFRFHWRQ